MERKGGERRESYGEVRGESERRDEREERGRERDQRYFCLRKDEVVVRDGRIYEGIYTEITFTAKPHECGESIYKTGCVYPSLPQ
ncbi:hypothetical protein J6590_093724 [Homalodisca vitripennis]|nr:hypothetical protein J6590_093724 [Homalodisca vitripennis]